MTEQERNKMLDEMLSERLQKGAAALRQLKILPKVYAEMNAKGYREEMKAMRDVVFWQLVLNPNTTEDELIKMIMPD